MAVSSVAEPGGTLSYVGNPDYRGFLAGLAANGDANAQALIGSNGSLGLVNNSGDFSNGQQFMAPLSAAINNANASDWATYESLVNGSGSGGNSGSSSSSSTVNPATQSYYNDIISQLQAQLGAAQNEQPTIISNIENAEHNQENQLNQQESAAESGYNTQRAQNGVTRANNVDSINENAGSTYRSLMSLLGAAGAGVSSAARFGAPQAVSLDASGKRAGADQTYNSNDAAISTAEGQTKQQYGNALTDLLTQENTDKGNALSSLLNQEASINQQITQAQTDANMYAGETFSQAQQRAPVQAVNNIESQLGDIFKQYATPTFNVSPVTASTPNLTTYKVDPTTIAAENSNPNTESAFLPYLTSLNPNANKQNGNTNLLTGGTTGASSSATAATAGAAA